MVEPRLYEWYSAGQAISFFGARRDAQSHCDGQWLLFPGTAICLATVGAAPERSHFENAGHFCWVADRDYGKGANLEAGFVPQQVIGPEGKKFSIRLFVRPAGAETYLYAGELEPSYMRGLPRGEFHGMARFELKAALPSQVWLQLGGLTLGNIDPVAVDRALERLRSPTTVEDRLDVLRQLVEYWHGPIRPEDGMDEAELEGIAMPMPLRSWYRWAGNRTGIMTGQNILFKPRDEKHKYWQLNPADGYLFFYSENQGVYHWATLPEGEDPPVFGRWSSKDPWEPENITLSEHLMAVCLFEAIWCHANYGASAAWLDEDSVAELIERIPPVAIGGWQWMGGTFYAGNGAFMVTMHCGESDGKRGYSVFIGAKTEHPLQFLKPYVDDSWDYVAL